MIDNYSYFYNQLFAKAKILLSLYPNFDEDNISSFTMYKNGDVLVNLVKIETFSDREEESIIITPRMLNMSDEELSDFVKWRMHSIRRRFEQFEDLGNG